MLLPLSRNYAAAASALFTPAEHTYLSLLSVEQASLKPKDVCSNMNRRQACLHNASAPFRRMFNLARSTMSREACSHEPAKIKLTARRADTNPHAHNITNEYVGNVRA